MDKEAKPTVRGWLTKVRAHRSVIKGIVHPKMNILASFTHPHVVPNLYKFLSYNEHEKIYFE